MDELSDVLSNCPRCLQASEITGVGDDLVWICGCGIIRVQ
jgi:hypothetical protein